MSKQRDRSEAAGDVATEAFMNAWRYRTTFKPEKKFFTWICGIAKNEWSAVRRKWAKRCNEQQDSELEIIPPRLPPGVDPEINDPLTYTADRKESKDHVDGLACEKQADARIERFLDDIGDEFEEEDDILELTAEEEAAMDAKEDALQHRLRKHWL
jgi:DNA-directed RNA polymerase specialized sigma24 family protein